MNPKDQFAGVWKLVSIDAIRRSGDILPIYGKNPIGRLYYDSDGNMSVHFMKAGRPKFKSETKFRATPHEMRAAYESYEAYFSTYEVDEANHLVHHYVLGGLFPNWTGTDQARYYRFEGKQLILSTAPVGQKPVDKAIVVLVWEKLVP